VDKTAPRRLRQPSICRTTDLEHRLGAGVHDALAGLLHLIKEAHCWSIDGILGEAKERGRQTAKF
jgi:hypothetical protein